MDVIKDLLQGLPNIVTKYTKKVLDNVVAPMLEAHIVQTLFLQKQTMVHVGAFVLSTKRDYTVTKVDG